MGIVSRGLVRLLIAPQVTVGAVVAGIATGAVPGASMGWHVSLGDA